MGDICGGRRPLREADITICASPWTRKSDIFFASTFNALCTVSLSHPSASEDPRLQCPLHARLVNQRAHPDHGVAQHLVLLLEVDHLDPDLVKVRRPDQADEALLYHGVAGVVAWPGLLHRLVQAEPNLEMVIRMNLILERSSYLPVRLAYSSGPWGWLDLK